MSLLEEAMKDFVIMNKVSAPDGYGGVKTYYAEGATVRGALVWNNAPEMRIAEAMGSTNVYSFTVTKDINLDYHDVIKRVSDGSVFRITNNADEYQTPQNASLNMKQYTAESWSIPT